jgi:hypothetical protein
MKKSELKKLIREEIQKVLKENEWSYPYFDIEIDDYSEISTANRVYDELKGTFKGKTEDSETGATFTFQEEEDWGKFYDSLLDRGIPENVIIGGDYN